MRFALSILLLLPQLAAAIEATPAVKVTPLLKTGSTWAGAPIRWPQGEAEVTGLIVEMAAGGETGWHHHPVPSFAYILQGELEVRLLDGRAKRLKEGDSLAEVIETPHNGRSVGAEPLRLVVFYAGAVGTSITVKEPYAQVWP